jgi:hypothetical protein
VTDSFPVTLNRTQWQAIAGMLSIFAEPAAHALTVQIIDNLDKPQAARFRMLVAGDGELFLVPEGGESIFRKKDLDGEHLHDYYSWVATLEDLTFAHPVERQQI